MPAKLNDSNKRRFVPPLAFQAHDWENLNSILERELTRTEQQSIEENITRIAAMRMSAEATMITVQEIKRGLNSFANLSDDRVIGKFKTAHVLVQAEIENALVEMGLPHTAIKVTDNRPAAIVAAALLARHRIKEGTSGEKPSGYRIELAKCIVALWKSLGRTDMKAYENFDLGWATTLVEFAAAIYEVTEPESPPSYSTVAKLLREVT